MINYVSQVGRTSLTLVSKNNNNNNTDGTVNGTVKNNTNATTTPGTCCSRCIDTYNIRVPNANTRPAHALK